MWNFINENAGALSVLGSLATIIIWAIYLQLLFGSYRESRRPKILINRGAGPSLDGRCLIANMSAKPIYIEAVMLDFTLKESDAQKRFSYCLSNLNFETAEEPDTRRRFFQGPLGSGEHIDIGSFKNLINTMSPEGFRAFDRLDDLTITTVATCTADDRLAAAERTFDILEHESEILLSPRSYTTSQIRSRSGRRRIDSMMQRLHRSERENSAELTSAVTRQQ